MSLHIRPARASDLDALTEIGIAAFPYEPQWPYRYPYRAQYPQDHYKYSRIRYSEWLAAANTSECIIMVAEGPSIENPDVYKPVALSIWRVLSKVNNDDDTHKLKPPKPMAGRRDSNPSHMAAYRASVGRAQSELFDSVYGNKQLSLAQLATHPDYFRRGAGTMLAEWGMELAEKNKWTITVFAGPMAYTLYGRLGFRTVGIVTTQVKDEEEKIEFPGMVWEPSSLIRDRMCSSR